jgi:hypothetical protein
VNDPTAQTPAADDLARLRELRPAWHIRHASEDHPGELGYTATMRPTRNTPGQPKEHARS